MGVKKDLCSAILQLLNHLRCKIHPPETHGQLDEIAVLGMGIKRLLQLVSESILISHFIHHYYIMCQGIAGCKHNAVIIYPKLPMPETFAIQRIFAVHQIRRIVEI